MEEQQQSTLKETTQTTTSEETTNPHWLRDELNEILEQGMFKVGTIPIERNDDD